MSARKSVERFSHAKCYVFDGKKAVVGSSNFTHMGLEGNIELNAVLYQPAVAELVSDWFERRWEKAVDAKEDLIHLVEESKFGLPLDPHTMYMKMLYEYYRQRIDDMETMKGRGVELTEFQQDAVTEAKRILRKYDRRYDIRLHRTGAKTHIGVELLRLPSNGGAPQGAPNRASPSEEHRVEAPAVGGQRKNRESFYGVRGTAGF